MEWQVFFALEGGWPHEQANWRAGAIAATLSNVASGLAGKRGRAQPRDFYPPTLRDGVEGYQSEADATEATRQEQERQLAQFRAFEQMANLGGGSVFRVSTEPGNGPGGPTVETGGVGESASSRTADRPDTGC